MTPEIARMTILTIVALIVTFGAGYYVHRRFGAIIEGWRPW
jgi:hypothetical protein